MLDASDVFLFLLLCILSLLCGFCWGASYGISSTQSDAVKHGHAHYSSDLDGNSHFAWKCEGDK